MSEGRDRVLRSLVESRPAGLSVVQPDPAIVRKLRAVVKPNPLLLPKPCVLGTTCFLFEFQYMDEEGKEPLSSHHCNVWLSGVQAPDDQTLDPFFSLPGDDAAEDNIYRWLMERELRIDLHYVNENYCIVGDVFVRHQEEDRYFSLCHSLVEKGLARVVSRHPNLRELIPAEEKAHEEGKGYWECVKAEPDSKLQGKVVSVLSGFIFRVQVEKTIAAPQWMQERLEKHRNVIRLHLAEVIAPQLNERFYHEARNLAVEKLFNKTVEIHVIAYYAGVELIKEPVVVPDDYCHFKGTVFFTEEGQHISFQKLLAEQVGTAQVVAGDSERAYKVPWCRLLPPHNYAIRESPDYRQVLLARFNLLETVPNIYDLKTLPFENRDITTYQHRPTNASLKWIASKQQVYDYCVRKTAKEEPIFATFQSVKLHFGDTPGLLCCSVLLHLPEDELNPVAEAPPAVQPSPSFMPAPSIPVSPPLPQDVPDEDANVASGTETPEVRLSMFNEDDEVEVDEGVQSEETVAPEREQNCVYRCAVQIYVPLTHPLRAVTHPLRDTTPSPPPHHPECTQTKCPLYALHSNLHTLSDAQVRCALAHLVEKEVLLAMHKDCREHRLQPVDGRLSFFGLVKTQDDQDILEVVQKQRNAFDTLEPQERDSFIPRWPHVGIIHTRNAPIIDAFYQNQKNPELRFLYAHLHWIAPFLGCCGRCICGVRVSKEVQAPPTTSLWNEPVCCDLRLLAHVSRELCLSIHSTTRLSSARHLNRSIFRIMERATKARVFDVRFFTGFPRIVRDKNLQHNCNDLNPNHFPDLLSVSRLDQVNYDRFPHHAVRFMGAPWKDTDTHRLLAEFAPPVLARCPSLERPPVLVHFRNSRLYCTLLSLFFQLFKRPRSMPTWVGANQEEGSIVQTIVLRRLGNTKQGILYECNRRMHFPQDWDEEAEARKDGRVFCSGPEKQLTRSWKTHMSRILLHHLTDLGPFSLRSAQIGPSCNYDPCADDDNPMSDHAGYCSTLDFHHKPLGLACVLVEEERVLLPQFGTEAEGVLVGRSALFRCYTYGGRSKKRTDQLYKGQPQSTDFTTYEKPLQRNAERGNYLLWWCSCMLHRAYGTFLAFCSAPPSFVAMMCLEQTQLLRDGCVALGLNEYLADNYERTAQGDEAENWKRYRQLREAEETYKEAERTFMEAPQETEEREKANKAKGQAKAALDQAKRFGFRARQALFQGSTDVEGVCDRLFSEVVTLLDTLLHEAVVFMEGKGIPEAIVKFEGDRFDNELKVRLWSMAEDSRRQDMQHDDKGPALFKLRHCPSDLEMKVVLPSGKYDTSDTRSFREASIKTFPATATVNQESS